MVARLEAHLGTEEVGLDGPQVEVMSEGVNMDQILVSVTVIRE